MPAFNPSNFTNPTTINNPFLPWVPGTTFVYQSADHTIADYQTVTGSTRVLDAVRCVEVLDTVNINGTVVTFTVGAPVGNQVLLGPDLATTLANLAAESNTAVERLRSWRGNQ